MSDYPLLKDSVDTQTLKHIATAIKSAYPQFSHTAFINAARKQLPSLELKQRIQHIIKVLHQYLPDDFEHSANILFSTKQHWPKQDENNPYAGFAAWPLIDYVSEYGLQHPQKSLEVLRHLTSLFSSEFAVRAFLVHHFDMTYSHMQQWCSDSDYHVRRLASEGSRPRLPWGQRLNMFCKQPKPVLLLLEKLKDDESEYVRRSVANNLNDISKDNPQIVIETCQRWCKKASADRRWIIRHATRSLVKVGHPQVFALLGYTEKPKIELKSFRINNKRIRLGDNLGFAFKLTSKAKQPQKLQVDYAVHHMKNNGQHSPKTFKFKQLSLDPGETVSLEKQHSIKAISTRKYYNGKHFVELIINGKAVKKTAFHLCTD